MSTRTVGPIRQSVLQVLLHPHGRHLSMPVRMSVTWSSIALARGSQRGGSNVLARRAGGDLWLIGHRNVSRLAGETAWLGSHAERAERIGARGYGRVAA